MDKDKMAQQAKVLRDKKNARMVTLIKQLRPKVENGVVKYDRPQAQEVQQFASPSPIRTARTILPVQKTIQQQAQTQQKINPQKIVQTQTKGCSGCSRKLGNS